MMAMRHLNLSEEQKASVRDLVKKQRESARPLAQQARAARQELKAALAQENPDPARVGRLTLAMHQVRQQQQAQREQFRQQFAGLLTPEQKSRLDQLESLRQQRRELLRQWHQDDSRPGPDQERPGR